MEGITQILHSMATKNSQYALITDKRTLPFNETGTGLVVTQGKAVTGTGTLFLSEMQAGSWLVDLTQDEVRLVKRVDSNTLAFLDQAFTSNVASVAPEIINKNNAHVVSISVQIPAGAGNGEIDGQVMPEGTSVTFSKDSRDDSGRMDFIDPIVADATGTQMQILISR